MAQTYTARTNDGVSVTSVGSVFSIYNVLGSARVVRVYRIWATNFGTSVTNGVNVPITLQRLNTGTPTGGTSITPTSHDSTNESLVGLVDCRTGFTGGASVVTSTIYRSILVTTDEPAVSALTPDEFWAIPAMTEIWDAGHRDSNVEPITLRPQEGIELRQTVAGTASALFQFTAMFTVANT